MKSHHLLAITGAALLAIVTAFWATSVREPTGALASTGPLFAGLKSALNDVDAVQITTSGGTEAVTLQRGDKRWSVRQAMGYPADSGKIRELLLALADAQLLEEKTASPDNYHHLGVEDIGNDDAGGQLVTLNGLPEAAAVIVGNRPSRGGTYVRRPGEAQSWLTGETITLDTLPTQWLDKRVTDIQAAKIQRVVIRHADGAELTLTRAARGDSNLTVANLPEGRSISGPAATSSIASALTNLNFDDVLPASAFEAGDAAPVVADYFLFDGTHLTITAYKIDDAHHLQFTAAFDAAQATRFAPGNVPFGDPGAADAGSDDTGVGDPAADLAVTDAADTGLPAGSDAAATGGAAGTDDAAAEVDVAPPDFTAAQEQVDMLASRVDGWVYRVPAHKYNPFAKRLDDLLAPVE